MNTIDRIDFVWHATTWHRRHYVTEDDIKVVLARLPDRLWQRLRAVHFNDHARGNRRLGYTTRRGRREIALCALPSRVSLVRIRGAASPQEFGALRGSQWPVLAVRRFMMYNTFLHELGHLQIILPRASNPNRKFASETRAQEFADLWRKRLWSQPFQHPDPVHNPPDEGENRALREGWIDANLEYKEGHRLKERREHDEARKHYQRAIDLYPNHALALRDLGRLTFANADRVDDSQQTLHLAADLLRRSLCVDPMLADAHLFLAMASSHLGQHEQSRCHFERAVQLDPCKYCAMTVYADHLATWGCWDEAEKLFRKALKADPQDSMALLYYGRRLLEHSDDRRVVNQAIGYLKNGVSVKPSSADHQYYLGLAYSRLAGHRELAVKHLREALQIRPGFAPAEELLTELRSLQD